MSKAITGVKMKEPFPSYLRTVQQSFKFYCWSSFCFRGAMSCLDPVWSLQFYYVFTQVSPECLRGGELQTQLEYCPDISHCCEAFPFE